MIFTPKDFAHKVMNSLPGKDVPLVIQFLYQEADAETIERVESMVKNLEERHAEQLEQRGQYNPFKSLSL